mmetsp:Transcript_36857/g.59097  ORF Transcript_36857/g.59097 Transcript_36857/m.59097 type:complete len:886 (-) Transcript_36857:127-2784(-)
MECSSLDSLPLPIVGDESYQGPPDSDFENSRGVGILAFKQSAVLDSSTSQTLWGNAVAQKGACPSDFSFLLGNTAPLNKVSSDGSLNAMSDEDACSTAIDAKTACISSGISSEEDTVKRCASGKLWKGAKRGRKAMELEAFAPCQDLANTRSAPYPAKRPVQVPFGKVEGQERGENPMDPPLFRTDVFSWLRTDDPKEDPEISKLLTEENHHTDSSLAHLKNTQDEIVREMMGHQIEAETSLITLHPGGYGYFNRSFVGKSYQAHYRRKLLDDGNWGDEELILDENALAINPADGSQQPYFVMAGPVNSPSHKLYAYGIDFAGNDAYTLHLCTCEPQSQQSLTRLAIERTSGSIIWNAQGDAFYYTVLDSEFRAYAVKMHRLEDDPTGAEDATVIEENDQKFCVEVSCTSCERFVIITISSSETAEEHLLDLHHPAEGLRCVARRTFSHRYHVDHRGGYLYVLTNKDGARNSKICRLPVASLPNLALDAWEDVWVPPEGTVLNSLHCFQDFFIIEGRQDGVCQIFARGYEEESGIPLHRVAFPDAASHSGSIRTPRGTTKAQAAFSAGLGSNPFFKTDVIRYNYCSFTVPNLTYEYCVRSQQHRLIKTQEVPNFDPNIYRAERIITSNRSVPISLVYRKDIHPKGLAGGPFPVLLTGYGAYGSCSDPDFDGHRLSLLDRGMVYALAHIRGGGELGHDWYDQGRYLNVKNRFLDFVDAADTLLALQIAAPGKIVAWGTSSGGLLVTASMNLRPELFKAVLLEVPFVDAMNTMADPSIPLTIGEWEEIGNPNELKYFYYMQEYSPYDNIRMADYPAILATSSLNDSMVGYWEPFKYVSKMRLLKTDSRPVLLQVNFHEGHGGTSDRYQSMRENARYFAFFLDQLGML